MNPIKIFLCKPLSVILIMAFFCPAISYGAAKPNPVAPQSQDLSNVPANSAAAIQNSHETQNNLIEQKQAMQDLVTNQAAKKKPVPPPPPPPVVPPAPIAPPPAPVKPPAPPVFRIQPPTFVNGELRFEGPNAGSQYLVTRDFHLILKNADGSLNELPLNENAAFSGPNNGTYRFDQFGILFFQSASTGNLTLFKLKNLANFFRAKRNPPPPVVVKPPPPPPPVVVPPPPPPPPAQKPPKKKK